MYKIIAYILIFILLFGAVSGPFSFKYNQKIHRSSIKKAIRAGVDDSETETFTVSNDEIEKKFHFIHSKEFRYKNKLYDIISKKEKKDSVTFIVINDENEERLIEVFQKFMPYETKISNVVIFNLIKSLNLTAIFYFAINFAPEISKYYNFISEFNIINNFITPEEPPPKCIFI